MAVGQNLVPLVNIKIAGKWMFIPLELIIIDFDPPPYRYRIDKWFLRCNGDLWWSYIQQYPSTTNTQQPMMDIMRKSWWRKKEQHVMKKGEHISVLPSGKHTKSHGKSQSLTGKSTINMCHFLCRYVKFPEGISFGVLGDNIKMVKPGH